MVSGTHVLIGISLAYMGHAHTLQVQETVCGERVNNQLSQMFLFQFLTDKGFCVERFCFYHYHVSTRGRL